MAARTDTELAAYTTGSHALHAYPPEHVLHKNSAGYAFTVANLARGDEILARCPDGQDRWLSPAEYGRVVHFAGDPKARRAASGRTRSAEVPRPVRAAAVSRAAIAKLEQQLKALGKANREARAIREFHKSLRPLQREAAMRASWQTDPRGTAIACLAVLGHRAPTEDQIRHAIARAGY